MAVQTKIRAAVLGASGYTGADLIRLAARHPNIVLTALIARGHAAQPLAHVFPHLATLDLPALVTSDEADEDRSWWDSIHDLRSKATAALQRIEGEAKGALSRVAGGVSGGAGAARDFAAERASVVSGFTSDLRDRLSHGLDGIPDWL